MIYLIGGAPRAGKSILTQRFAARLGIGWVSTDLLMDLLRVKQVPGVTETWDASPAAISASAEWFYPVLERFAWGVSSMAESYIIEGVGFLPAQVGMLAQRFAVRAVFLGCAKMTFERFDQFPGRSQGYASLPEALKRQFAADIPLWSEFIRQQAQRAGCAYIDTSADFETRLGEAEAALLGDSSRPGNDS